MPELPDLTLYLEHLDARVRGEVLEGLRLLSPFLLRSVTPTVDDVSGRRVIGCSRLAKQLVIGLEGDYYLVLHLMIAGRLHWHDAAGAPQRAAASVRGPRGSALAAFDFSSGTLVVTEVSKKKRAALRLVHGTDALAALDPGGLEVLNCDAGAFAARLRATRHTLKRALTDQRVLAGIGNAYSDEILLRAGMSPFKLASSLDDAEMERLFEACRAVLQEWTMRLREQARGAFPKKVTAFHPEMAVHGRYRQPCPQCGSPVQRIRYAENEANYCARCQTGGRLLADRSLSRLLKDNWPKRLEDLE